MTTEAATKDKSLAPKRKTITELLQDPGTNKRFQEMLGKDARSFQQNILTVVNTNKSLAECDPASIIAAAEISASINLSILPSLGHSCIVPYREGKDGPQIAQWQIMWKGLVQLAHRSGQYKRLNLAHVYEGELVSYDKFRGIIKLDESLKKSCRVQGYYFYFELINGGQYEYYWSAKDCIEHGLRYSKSFQKGTGKWTEDPVFEKAGSVKKWLDGKEHFLTEGSGADAMSGKTIVKNELNTWGPLETRIKEIIALDQATIYGEGRPTYIDTTAEPAAAAKTYEAPPERQIGKEPTPAEKLAWAKAAAAKQGVDPAQFDTWVAAQGPQPAADIADTVTALWKRVVAKEITAADAFKLGTEGRRVSFDVGGVSQTDVDSADAWVIRDTSEPAIKYYTDSPEMAEVAEVAKKKEQRLSVQVIDRVVGDKTILWISSAA